MVESTFTEHWDRLLFRDYLIEHPAVARDYERSKLRLASGGAGRAGAAGCTRWPIDGLTAGVFSWRKRAAEPDRSGSAL
jgi:hypothetical protein